MNRRAFFRTMAAAAVAAPVVPTTLGGAYPGFVPVLPAAVVPAGLVGTAFSLQALYNFHQSMMVETVRFDVLTGWATVGPRRLTLAEIKGYGSPDRLPA